MPSVKQALAPIPTIALGALALSVALTSAVVGPGQLLAPSIDIQLHNTYFVVAPYFLVAGLFLPLLAGGLTSYLLYRRYPPAALALLGLGTVLISPRLWLMYTFSNPIAYTIYPPLDPAAPLPASLDMTFGSILLLVLLQLATVLAVIALSYKAGKRSTQRI
jgi:hypothetical protein